VVAAAFAVFPPELIDQLWTDGLAKLDRAELIALRTSGVAVSLRKVLGDVTTEQEVLQVAETLERAAAVADGAGRPLFSRCARRPCWPTRTPGCGGPPTGREHRGRRARGHLRGGRVERLRDEHHHRALAGLLAGRVQQHPRWSREAHEQAVASLTVSGLVTHWEITEDGRAFRTGWRIARTPPSAP